MEYVSHEGEQPMSIVAILENDFVEYLKLELVDVVPEKQVS